MRVHSEGGVKKTKQDHISTYKGGGLALKLLSEFEFETTRAAFAARRFALQMGKKRNRHISF